MGGGRGSRLSPLTKERCKPAVPLAGKYRLVDIPISNCLNSGYNNMYMGKLLYNSWGRFCWIARKSINRQLELV